jgi:hypothetical protein
MIDVKDNMREWSGPADGIRGSQKVIPVFAEKVSPLSSRLAKS